MEAPRLWRLSKGLGTRGDDRLSESARLYREWHERQKPEKAAKEEALVAQPKAKELVG